MTAVFGLVILLVFVGSVLPGVAVRRSGTRPRWAGTLWVASALLFYVLGAMDGMLTTGSILPTQPVGRREQRPGPRCDSRRPSVSRQQRDAGNSSGKAVRFAPQAGCRGAASS